MTDKTVTVTGAAISAAAAIFPPSLYVGADKDRAPYTPPVASMRGWRVAVGPPVVLTAAAASITALAKEPLTAVSLASLYVNQLTTATVMTIDPVVGTNFQSTAVAPTASAAGIAPTFITTVNADDIAPAVAELAAPGSDLYVGHDRFTAASATIEAIPPNIVIETTASVPSAEAVAAPPNISYVAKPTVTSGTAATIAPIVGLESKPAPTSASAATSNPEIRRTVNYEGSNVAIGTSVAIPAHNAGDLILIWAWRATGSTPPTKPTAVGTVPAWIDITNNTGVTSSSGEDASARTAYFIATSNNHTTGTWTNAEHIIAVVLSGQYRNPIGGVAEESLSASVVGTISSVTAPEVTLATTSGRSQLLHFMVFNGTVDRTFSTTPTGYTVRHSATGATLGYRMMTKNVTTSDGAVTCNLSGSTSVTNAITIEIVG